MSLLQVLDVLLDIRRTVPLDLRSIRLVNKETLRCIDRGVTSLRLSGAHTPLNSESALPQRFQLLRSLDISEAWVQSFDPFLLACKQLRSVRCKLKQALATRSDTEELELDIVGGDQDRGFGGLVLPIKRLTIGLTLWRPDLSPQVVSNLQHLKIEGLEGAHISLADIQNISSSTRLESLCLRHCIEDVLDPISIISKASRLTSLDFSYNLRNNDLSNNCISTLRGCPLLRDLDVSFTKVSTAGLIALSSLTLLTRLAANSCDIEDRFGRQISETFPILAKLELGGSWDLTRFVPAVPLEHLEHLDVSNCFNLKQLLGVPNLQSLCAGGVVTSSLSQLSTLTRLTHIDLSHKSPRNIIDDELVLTIRTLTKLQDLNLDGAFRLTDAGIIGCTSLRCLRKLNVSRSQMTSVAVNALSCVYSMELLTCFKCTLLDVDAVTGYMKTVLKT